jgi:hypothetical protein
MKVLRKIKEEKGSITMTVVAAMLFIISAVLIAYFSLSNQSNDQSKKTRQIADSYKVTNSDLVQKYKDVQDNLDDITTMSITKIKSLGDIMFAKGTNTVVNDELGNKFIVPAGFKVTDDADNITEGMVIQDKDENEFVWIPVGIKKKSNPNETITLGRYLFDSNGNSSEYSGSAIEEDSTDPTSLKNYGNIIAKNINEFILKTNQTGGFYIGRYEARIEGYTGRAYSYTDNEENSFTDYIGGKLVEKPNEQVFNFVTQNKAAELSRSMYNSNNFESDLINSYAWDTAILFLQEYDNRTNAVKSNTNFYKEKYSLQGRLSANGIKNQGTNDSNVPESSTDKICNVYDMADNCIEWSTETMNNNSVYCCVRRGGGYAWENVEAQNRDSGRGYKVYDYLTFRPILYIK